MRRVLGIVLGIAVMALTGCGDDDDGGGRQPQTQPQPMSSSVYFGAVGMTTDRLAIALDGNDMRIFLTDGEPGGDAEWFEGSVNDGKFSLRSASGRARIEGTVERAETHGTVTLADGQNRHFHTIPATHGAGIYDITVQGDHYTGTSSDGSTYDARQVGDYVQGSLTLKGGEKFMFRNVDLSRAFSYATLGGQPGAYKLVVSRFGLTQMGRGVQSAGSENFDNRLIALDLAASNLPTPGIYYGRTAQSIHQLAMSVDNPDARGERRVRVYFSDGLPNGDIEWFVGPTRAGQLQLTSASTRARLNGTFTDTEAKGTITTASGRSLPFFAVPAGDGAGIYEIEVTADKRYIGTSEKGERLEAKQEGDVITGTITVPNGPTVQLFAYDLTGVFEYPQAGSQPDRYVAFASPGGRYFIGRSGNVRGGTAGNNIIGLDKAC